MTENVELISLFWTTAGIFPGVAEISRFDFRERVEAAARAGFVGIGIWYSDLRHTLEQRSLKEMKAILDDNGMKYLELEFLTDWFVDGERKAESDRRKRRLLEASAALGAKHVKVGDFDRTVTPMPRLIEAFAALCQEAEAYGATIAFEFMASSMLNNLADSRTMVESAGAKNGGLALDIVHVETLGIPHAQVAAIPAQYLISVELNDGALPGSPLYDPARARRYCGEGDFDVRGFIAAVRQTGYTHPRAVEVISEELVGLPLDELSQRAYATTLAQLAPGR